MKKIIKSYDEDNQLIFEHDKGSDSFHFYKYTNNSVIESIIFPKYLKKTDNKKISFGLFQYFTQKEYCKKTNIIFSSIEFGNHYFNIKVYNEGKEIFSKTCNLEKNTDLTKSFLYINDKKVGVENYNNKKTLNFDIDPNRTKQFIKLIENGRKQTRN